MKLRVSVGESKKLIGNTILLLSKSTFYQCISIKENDTNYWNIIATKISEDKGTEYKYIDITDDVQLIGYKYLSDNSTNNVILSSIDTYDTEHPCGPLITNNTTNIKLTHILSLIRTFPHSLTLITYIRLLFR